MIHWRPNRFTGRCAFTRDGGLLAMGDYSVGVWDVDTGRKLRELAIPPDEKTGHGRSVGWICFSPDGKLIAATARGQRAAVLMWSVKDGELRRSVQLDVPGAYSIEPRALSADGSTIAIRETHHPPALPGLRVEAGAIRMASSMLLFDTATGRRLLQLSAAAMVCNGGRMLVEPGVRVYDMASGKLLRTIAARGRPVVAGSVLVAGLAPENSSDDTSTFGFWDLDSGEMRGSVSLDRAYYRPTALSPDASLVVSDSSYRLCVVSRAGGKKILELYPKTHLDRAWRFHNLTFSGDARKLAFIHDGVVGVVDLPALTLAAKADSDVR